MELVSVLNPIKQEESSDLFVTFAGKVRCFRFSSVPVLVVRPPSTDDNE